MRIGVIGCGWIAETHLANLKTLGEQVACVCDPDPGRVPGQRVYGAEPFADWESLLSRGEPEAVLVLTPPRAHREITVGALERGLPVYLEKPVARDLEDARSIVATAGRTGVVCAIGYQWRAITWMPQLRDLFARRALGRWPYACSAPAGRTWFTDRAAGGGQVLGEPATASTSCGRSPARRCASRQRVSTCR
jgi:predicted dehydrogenase